MCGQKEGLTNGQGGPTTRPAFAKVTQVTSVEGQKKLAEY